MAGSPDTPPEMAPMPTFTIYNLPPAPQRWDRVGIAFVTFCLTWTTLLIAGMAVCLVNRNNPILRVRGLPLSFTAIGFLHAYWILAWLVYPVGGAMPVVLAYDIQYFFMGIWFPLGVAVFHASNLRFLYVARRQKRFLTEGVDRKDECNGASSSILCRLRNLPYMTRVMMFVGIGMVAQVLLTVGMWFACKKYHPTYGIPGTEIRGDTLEEQMIDLGRGWEWWPSVMWQVLWTWIVAPILLWRAWTIRDTLGWRTQTVGCFISSLHATPMFLIASYVPAFNKVNAYFPPSQWIHLSIMMFEVFTVFVPLIQLFRHTLLTRRASALNAKWGAQSLASTQPSSRTSHTITASNSPFRDPSSHKPSLASLSFAEKGAAYSSSAAGSGGGGGGDAFEALDDDRLYTMAALEHVLADNPVPLQDFSALNDFSGENVAFLRRAAAWRAEWDVTVAGGGGSPGADQLGEMQRQEELALFNRALDLYGDFIDPSTAEFPLNLSSKHLAALQPLFLPAIRTLAPPSPVNPATPFDFPSSSASGCSGGARDLYTGDVPGEFGADVFDAALAHVKYLVLTNTWPKFVAEMQARRRRSGESEGERSVATEGSGVTFASRVSSRLGEMLNSLLRNYR